MLRKFLWATPLVILMATGWAVAADEVDYFAILTDGSKIGHSVQTRSVRDGKVVTTNTTVMSTERLGMPITVSVTQENTETPDGKPLGFKNVQNFATMVQEVVGQVTSDGKMIVTIGTGGQTKPQTMAWPPGALLSEGVRLLQKQKGLKEGTAYSYVEFDPMGLRGMETTVRILGKKLVDVLGHQETLWEVQAQMGGIGATIYVNNDLKTRKSTASEAGMNIETVACTKEFALGQDASVDLVSKVMVSSPQALPNLGHMGVAIYHLAPRGRPSWPCPALTTRKLWPIPGV